MAKAVAENKEQTQNTYVYQSATPCFFNYDGKEYSLYKNETYQLPDCPFVQSLTGQGHLIVKK